MFPSSYVNTTKQELAMRILSAHVTNMVRDNTPSHLSLPDQWNGQPAERIDFVSEVNGGSARDPLLNLLIQGHSHIGNTMDASILQRMNDIDSAVMSIRLHEQLARLAQLQDRVNQVNALRFRLSHYERLGIHSGHQIDLLRNASEMQQQQQISEIRNSVIPTDHLSPTLCARTATPIALNEPAGLETPQKKREHLRLHHNQLPCSIARFEDHRKLSEYQCFLRLQIEIFQASDDDVFTHTRGRNKPIRLGQIGVRCIHCSHLRVRQKTKGAMYFPSSLLGLYQAGQNMNSSHFLSGSCVFLPLEIKEKFQTMSSEKALTSGAGRLYWADAARDMGLVEMEGGISLIQHRV